MKYLKNINTGETRGNFRNLTGATYGDLTVIARLGSDIRRNSYWLCRCTCGVEQAVTARDLKRYADNFFCKHKPIPQQLDLFD